MRISLFCLVYLSGFSSRARSGRRCAVSDPPPDGGRRNDGRGPAGTQHYYGLDGWLWKQHRGQPSDSPWLADLSQVDSGGKPDRGNTCWTHYPDSFSHWTLGRLSRSSWAIRVHRRPTSATVYNSLWGREGVSYGWARLVWRSSSWCCAPPIPKGFEYVQP